MCCALSCTAFTPPAWNPCACLSCPSATRSVLFTVAHAHVCHNPQDQVNLRRHFTFSYLSFPLSNAVSVANCWQNPMMCFGARKPLPFYLKPAHMSLALARTKVYVMLCSKICCVLAYCILASGHVTLFKVALVAQLKAGVHDGKLL